MVVVVVTTLFRVRIGPKIYRNNFCAIILVGLSIAYQQLDFSLFRNSDRCFMKMDIVGYVQIFFPVGLFFE